MNDAFGMAPCAVRGEMRRAFSVQNRFSEDRPGRVTGTKKQNVVVSRHARFLNSLLVTAARTAARGLRFGVRGLDRADKRAQEFAVDLRGESFNIKPLACKKFARVFHAINARGLDVHLLKSGRGKLVAIFAFLQS